MIILKRIYREMSLDSVALPFSAIVLPELDYRVTLADLYEIDLSQVRNVKGFCDSLAFMAQAEFEFGIKKRLNETKIENVPGEFSISSGRKTLKLKTSFQPGELIEISGNGDKIIGQVINGKINNCIVEFNPKLFIEKKKIKSKICRDIRFGDFPDSNESVEIKQKTRPILSVKTFTVQRTVEENELKKSIYALENIKMSTSLPYYIQVLINRKTYLPVPTMTNITRATLNRLQDLDLDEFQLSAVKHGLTQEMSLIGGCAGCGKSETAAALVYAVNEEDPDPSAKIIVVGPSNISVDQLALRIDQLLTEKRGNAAPQSVRIYSSCYDDNNSNLAAHLSLTKQALKKFGDAEIIQMNERYNKFDLSDLEVETFQIKLENLKKKLLVASKIIYATQAMALNMNMNNITIDLLLFDETSSCTLTEFLRLAYHLKPRRIALIGDEAQLRPVVYLREASYAGLDTSPMSRYLSAGYPIDYLWKQYRLHIDIGRIVSQLAYNGNMIIRNDRKGETKISWKKYKKTCMLVYDTEEGKASHEGNSKSWYNQTELNIGLQLIHYLISVGIQQKDIGIITPYTTQTKKFREILTEAGYSGIIADNVDHFVGAQRKIIIYSLTMDQIQRSGFAVDARRLCVAMTRACDGLCILGNFTALLGKQLNYGSPAQGLLRRIWGYAEKYHHAYPDQKEFERRERVQQKPVQTTPPISPTLFIPRTVSRRLSS